MTFRDFLNLQFFLPNHPGCLILFCHLKTGFALEGAKPRGWSLINSAQFWCFIPCSQSASCDEVLTCDSILTIESGECCWWCLWKIIASRTKRKMYFKKCLVTIVPSYTVFLIGLCKEIKPADFADTWQSSGKD